MEQPSKNVLDTARILKALIKLGEVSTLLTNFIPAFLDKTILKSDGLYYLHGNFKLGGTISGRMSSNSVNLQNMPSTGSKYAKPFKKCFQAPKGYLMVGADFSSLEDRISALTTKDPNKLKVYLDGFDGHCLRAASYFEEELAHIDIDSVSSVNSITTTYPELRQNSKPPTFALTYQGTWRTLVQKCGFAEKIAKRIEQVYHELYAVSDAWVQKKLAQAAIDGYVTLAFGLRLRTPLLAQTVSNTSSTPHKAIAEGRSVGNALGQSYGLLNNRAAIEFMERVLDSPYRYSITPISHIHDSQYYLIPANLEALAWTNKHLIDCMAWQELSDIRHDKVKLEAQLELYYPSLAESISIPTDISLESLKTYLEDKLNAVHE